MNIPNLLSLLRILSIPLLIIALFHWSTGLFLLLLIVAALTDLADGFLARRLNQVTKSGAMLDTAADRLFAVSLFIALAVMHGLQPMLVAALLFRDIIVIIGWLILAAKYRSAGLASVKPTLLGKATTWLQIMAIGSLATGLFQGYIINIAIWFSLITGIQYLVIGIKRFFKEA